MIDKFYLRIKMSPPWVISHKILQINDDILSFSMTPHAFS